MTDDTKRKILRFLQRGDGAARRFGNRTTNAVHLPPINDDVGGETEKNEADEFENMTGDELSRELKRQLAYSAVFVILLFALVAGGIILVLTGRIRLY